MRLLLDTHTLIWYTEGIDKLSSSANTELEKADNKKFVSIASLWEIVIKASNGKLDLNYTLNEINEFLRVNDIELLGINIQHLNSVLELPHHHKDPFDRLLIAQAITENLTIISADSHFSAYPVKVLW